MFSLVLHRSQSWPCGQIQQQQYYPASQQIKSGTKIFAVIADDPDTLFQVAVCSSGIVMATVTQNAIGTNMSILATAGSTATGNSSYSVLSTSPAVTATFPVRVIDVVPATAPSGTTYSEVIVKINFGIHQYNNATGLAYA
jgi:orotate phosphoribosyltransferase-like protein